MTDLEKMREWLKTFPSGIPDDFQVDFTDEVPQNAGLFPTGAMEMARTQDICGNVTVTNQHNFALYAIFAKPIDVDEISARNAEWMMELQRWVQEQSVRGLAPVFGDVDTASETIRAQNGQFYGDKDAGVGVYMVTITAQYKIFYRSENKWLN